MFTPLPITPHHPRESPGCLLQASSSTRNFLNALYMQLLQCRLSCLYFWHQCVLCWGNACIKACFLASVTCAQYMMLFDAYPIHMLFVASIFANSVQRGFHVVVLGFGSINGEGVVGCEVWRGKVEVMMASLLHGKGKGRSWVEERRNAFAIVKRQGERESENQANLLFLLPISSWRQWCATSMPQGWTLHWKPKWYACVTMKEKPLIYGIFIENIKCIHTHVRLENGLVHLC